METFDEVLQKEMSSKKFEHIDETGIEFKEPVPEVKEVENKADVPKVEPKPEDNKVLSNTDSPKGDGKTEIPVADFESLIAERSNGRFKKWDEIEAIINEPKTVFANEQIQKINEFVKNGGKFDENWLYLQTTDFGKIEDPFELVAEAMRLDEPGITDKEIEYRIKTDYKTEEWGDTEDEENEVYQAMSARLQREADKARKKLIDFKEKSSISVPQKSQNEIQKEALQSKKVQEYWDKTVDENSKGFEKIAVKLNEKDTFDVIVSEDERKAISQTTKALGSSMQPLISKFLDKTGNIDVKLLQNYLYKAENFDNAVKNAFEQGKAKGSHEIVKDQKNINFKAEGGTETPKIKSIGEQIAEAVIKNGM